MTSINLKKALLTGVLLGIFLGGCSGSNEKKATTEQKSSTAPGVKSSLGEKVTEPPAPKMVFEGPGEMLPKMVGDFAIAESPRYFGPDNLYDLINGGAEIYAEFGLKKMVTVEYKSKKVAETSVTVEVYDQSSPLGAFGRMARFLTGRKDPSKAGEGLPADLQDRGLFGGTDLVFFKDHYLVHITLLDESPTASLESMKKKGEALLPDFAKAVAEMIKSNPPLPAEFARFPAEHRVARTEAWEPKDTAGVDGVGPGFSARYNDGEKSWTVLMTEVLGDEQTAMAQAESLQKNVDDRTRNGFAALGKRIVGFTTRDDAWTEKDRAAVMKQISQMGQ